MIDLATFLSGSIDAVRAVAPQTLIYTPGGTRRAAALNNIKVPSDEFVTWSRRQMMNCVKLLFDHGVKHVFSGMIFPTTWREITPEYRAQMLQWTAWTIAGDEALADYQRYGWKVRATGTEHFPPEYNLSAAAQRLEAETDPNAEHTLWLQNAPSEDAVYAMITAALQHSQARTRAEAIRSLYGVDVPPATMLISFGKLFISPLILPPLLIDNVQAYWTQKPGYSITAEEIRRIFYDAAYTRQTWTADKTNREIDPAVAAHTAIVGLGVRKGSHWYPDLTQDG